LYLSIQFLEDVTGIDRKTPAEWAEQLDRACDLLPLTHVVMGWKVPLPILEACENVISAHNAKLYRWHPLLTSDGGFAIKPDWRVLGLDGKPVPAFSGREDFTFICPNHPEATEIILNNLTQQLSLFDYQGVFLDRIRYPSPAANAAFHLGCFCEHCQRVAAETGLDLNEIRQTLERQATTAEGFINLTLGLVDLRVPEQTPLSLLLVFCQNSITNFIRQASDLAHGRDLEVALDCFSPSLAQMVGQNLVELSYHASWVKLMTYIHTFAPAGLPFELLGLIDKLTKRTGLTYSEIAGRVAETAGLPIPDDREGLINAGLPVETLAAEMRKVKGTLQCKALAGIELVDLRGVTRINDYQVNKSIDILTNPPLDGLALSWDLQYIPIQRLELVNRALFG
jgi:hypothetical protein